MMDKEKPTPEQIANDKELDDHLADLLKKREQKMFEDKFQKE